VVDGSGLENRRTRKGTGGSNPSLSAIAFFILHLHHSDTCIDNEKNINPATIVWTKLLCEASI
jgi:hypothetical protein